MRGLGVEYEKPKGGIYVWCRLPEGVDSKEFNARAYSNGISVLPGYVFYPARNGGRDRVRLNFSYETPKRLEDGMEIFRRSLMECLAKRASET